MLGIAKEKGLTCLQLIGDSQIVVEWENGKFRLENLIFVPLLGRIREVRAKFSPLSFQHVYREHNYKADQLSKEILRLQEGLMEVSEIIDGNAQSITSVSIYA